MPAWKKSRDYQQRAAEAFSAAAHARDPTAKALMYRLAAIWQKLSIDSVERRRDSRRVAA